MMRNYLFDAFPLLCWLQEEPGYELIDELLTEAETGKSSISMHIINLGEVFYRICRVSGMKRGEEILDKIRLLPIQILSISDEEVMEAAKIKAKYPISYADAFAVAKALQSGATVVTGDPEYKKVSKIIEILWVK
jgi:predicted nucleic acid-binding protein